MNKGNDHQLKMLLIVKQILIDSILGTYKDQYGECTDKCYKIFFLFSFDGSGFVAEHMDLRHFLTVGMLSSGLFTALFGMGYFWKLHYFAYFVTIQVYTMMCIYIYIYRKSASRFLRGTVLNTLKQSRINIMRGKKDATTFLHF